MQGNVNANALLGFQSDEPQDSQPQNNRRQKKPHQEPKKLLDNEGVDFSYYFSARYLNKHDKSASG